MNHETLLFTRSKSSNYDIHSAKAKMYSPQPLRNRYNLESLLFSQKHKESSNGLSSHFSSLNSFTPKLLIFEDDS